jgi:hypothetical protein
MRSILLATWCDFLSTGRARNEERIRPVPQALNKYCRIAVRSCLVGLGILAVAWGTQVMPVFARQAPIEAVAARVVSGDPFKSEVLATLMPEVEAAERAERCRPAALHSAAIIRTRITEQALYDGGNVDASLRSLSDSIHRSLACSSADPFLWFVLYWVESNRNGFQAGYLSYLRLSYQLGPNESWVALKRNRYALAVFQRLPPDLARMSITEFARLLDTGFYAETVATFAGPGWPERALLLPALKNVTERHRQAFARALYKLGYDVDVPGIARPDPRPWD